MALQALTEDGYMTWTCPCGRQQTAHVSHEEVQVNLRPGAGVEQVQQRTVQLPVCTCGRQTHLKVDFSDEELRAPNMWIAWNPGLEERLQTFLAAQAQGVLPDDLAEAGMTLEQLALEIAQLQTIKAAGGISTPSHAVAARHVALLGHLEQADKVLPAL